MKRSLLLFLFTVSLFGCAHTPKDYQAHMDLQYGMPKKKILDTLGPPSEYERYQKSNKVIVEYLIYKYFVSYEDKTPICFIDNKLVGWGTTYYQDHISSKDKRLK